MSARMSVDEYLQTEECVYRTELDHGMLVREAATPSLFHQLTVGRLYRQLWNHARERGAGVVIVSPMDVILDRERAVVVQPDVMFVAASRAGICTDRVWGAPDLAVEVLSPGNSRHDRNRKLERYRSYGVRECWLVDLSRWAVEVNDLQVVGCPRLFADDDLLRSIVLPHLALPVAHLFED
jgi:Uma2 family endonuclease